MTDDKYTVERAALVEAPPERVYEQVVDFHRWRAWSPWEDLDPDLQRDYSGPESGVGAVYAWSGNRKAGQGSMHIDEAAAPSRVGIDLVFEKPWRSRNRTVFTFDPEGPDGGATRVTWTMTGEKTFLTKVMGLFTSMDKMVGPDFEKGLNRLKRLSEGPSV